jgi:chromosome segregation ATPase
MKVEWIATLIFTLIGTFLMGLSVQSTRDLSATVETIKQRIQAQEEQNASTRSQMNSVAGELIRLKETQAIVSPKNLQDQVQEIIRQDREKQTALLQEKARLRALEDKYKAEKVRIQKLQAHIDLAKQQIDLADKNLEVEILTAVVESSVQKKIDNFSQTNAIANSKAMNEISKASLKGADRFGEVPYREPNSDVQSALDNSKDVSSVSQALLAKKSALMTERKKLSAQQRTLDEDKRKLANNLAALTQKFQASTLTN